MIREIVNLSVNGQGVDDVVPDIAEIEVEDHVDSAAVFRVRLSLTPRGDGTWTYLDDSRFAIWNRLSVRAGYPSDNDTIIEGYITHTSVSLSGSGAAESYLELSGMDASVMMDLEEKQAAWPNKKDNEIAQQIFSSYGLSWEVEDTQLQHMEKVTTILQSESDIRFLRRLAARNGFECYVKGSKGYFRSPNLQDPPQPVLALQFGGETNLASAHFDVDGTPPTLLEIRRVDPIEKREDREKLTSLPRRALGKQSLKALRSSAPDGRRLLKQQPSAGTLEMQAKLRSGYDAAAEFVTIRGEIDSRAYGAVLRAKRLVTIKGAGSTYSGLYYVTRVRHVFNTDGYTQSFEAYRNGLGRLGTESFAAAPALASIVPGSQAASVAAGSRVLPAQQSTTTLPGGS
jgi:phage protein D